MDTGNRCGIEDTELQIVTREAVVECARTYLGTPFHHQGRKKGLDGAIDCLGLLVGVAAELGIPHHDFLAYPRYPDKRRLLIQEMDKSLIRIGTEEMLPADVPCFWIRNPKRPHHVGIMTDLGIIHTHASVGKVVETSFDERWVKRVAQAYRFVGVEN